MRTNGSWNEGTPSCSTGTQAFSFTRRSTANLWGTGQDSCFKNFDGSEDAASCAHTFDELVWVVNRYRSREDALAAGAAFLALPSLAIYGMNHDVLFSASSLMRRYPLDPRDAIHASSAIIQGCSL